MIELIRQRTDKKGGTQGMLSIPGAGMALYTMEAPDLGNAPFVSCIPTGEYDLIPYDSPTYGMCYMAVSLELGVHPFKTSPGYQEGDRYTCLFFHRGNLAKNFQGCGGVGDRVYTDPYTLLPAIGNTRATCEIVNEMIEVEGSYRMLIRWEWE